MSRLEERSSSTSIDKEAYLEQVSKELHKPFKKIYPRKKVVARFKDEIWSCDLVDMNLFKDWNEHRYMLNCVDVFTRYAFSCPMMSKSAIDTYAAFTHICEQSGRKPKVLWVDQGKEFYNSVFKKAGYSPDLGTMYSTFGDHKSVICERFNRTMREKMMKILDSRNTRKWDDLIPEIIGWYNNRKHSTLGMTPKEASMKKNEEKIQEVNSLPQDELGKKRVPKFKIGDTVRIARTKHIFERGFDAKWSREVFVVDSVTVPFSIKEPITYGLVDRKREPITGSFYTEELQPVSDKVKDVFLVEEVLKTRTVKGEKQSLIKWLGYPDKFNSWIPSKDLESV